MKLKTLMMSAATAALFAGAATAQTDTEAPEAEAPAAEAPEAEAPESGMATEAPEGGMATEEPAADAAAPEAPEFTSIEEMTVGDVVGMQVYDPEGSNIGEIDYVIDGPDGAQAVIGIGGFLGLGEYTVALPLEDFTLSQDPMGFSLDTDKETLEQQPEFDESTVEPLPDDMMISELLPADDAANDTGAATGGEMETDAPDAEAPDAEAPEAEAPETDAPDAEADAEVESDAGATSGDAAATGGADAEADAETEAPDAEEMEEPAEDAEEAEEETQSGN